MTTVEPTRGTIPIKALLTRHAFHQLSVIITVRLIERIAVRAFRTASESITHKVTYYSGAFLRICNLGAIKFGSLRLAVTSEIPLSRPSAFPVQYISLFKAHFSGYEPASFLG